MKTTLYRISSAGLAFLALNGAFAASTDLSDVPLANATTVTMLPNIAFILDDSGSMDWEVMPADENTNIDRNCYRWRGWNTIWYNPATTYLAPLKADGTRYPDMSFTQAKTNGYSTSSNPSTTNLAALSSPPTTTSDVQFPHNDYSNNRQVTSVTIRLLDGTTLQLLSRTVPTTATQNVDNIGNAVRDEINANTGRTGFSASYDSGDEVLTITAPASQAGLTNNPVVTVYRPGNSSSSTIDGDNFSPSGGGSTYKYYATHKTNSASTGCETDSNYNLTNYYTDIAAPGTTAGSTQALTNYANWYSYYRKRIYLAKAAAAEAFGALPHTETINGVTTDRAYYRIGLFYLNNTSNNLAINDFSGTHRNNWFARLYGTTVDGSTPLRTALSNVGRMYAGKNDRYYPDPLQYSCQRNFAILTTDGFWNEGSTRNLSGNTIGDVDSGSAISRPFRDGNSQANLLADVAYYYYNTDLRPGTCSNPDVCTDNVPPAGSPTSLVDDVATHQHMTTFGIGLGVKGKLNYLSGYKNSTSGDYYDITQGSKDWPKVTNYSGDTDLAKIDDLWHAAVSGRGTYYSAQNSQSFVDGLGSALGQIEMTTGSGAAAATSNLQPTSGDNYIYIANFRTVVWDGELTAYEINQTTGEIASTNCTNKTTKHCWKVSEQLATKIQPTTQGSVLAGDADTRNIYTFSASGTNRLRSFEWAQLNTTERGYFANTQLSQYSGWSTANQSAASGEKLVKYLRGQNRNEDVTRDASYGTYYPLYRARQGILGDIIHTQPVFVGQPFYEYLDTGYESWKTSTAITSRPGTVYVGANDGMLHAFDATTGAERWAYIPPLLLPKLWHSADADYATHHQFLIDGPTAVSDIYYQDTGVTAWRTILVGALGKGGRGIYALDVTDPTAPKALWNFTSADNANLGYTYGTPIITKLEENGTWVILVASGYNNSEGGVGDGVGRVFVLNASTGALIKTFTTGEGSVATPSGLANLNIKVEDFQKANYASRIYGTDNLGNVWRFDPLAADGSTGTKVIALGASKPITVAPEIGEIDQKTVLFFGTGRYLGEDDLGTTGTQSFYAVKDDGSTTVTTGSLNPVTATITGSGSSEAITTSSSTPMNWNTMGGWVMNLPTSGERTHLPAQLYFGTILFSSTVPTANACQPGGYSWLYALDAATGTPVTGNSGNNWAAMKFVSPLVGITVAKVGNDPFIYGITADGGRPAGPPPVLPISPTSGGSESGLRVMWRELVN